MRNSHPRSPWLFLEVLGRKWFTYISCALGATQPCPLSQELNLIAPVARLSLVVVVAESHLHFTAKNGWNFANSGMDQ